jgi:hypothetical protein
MGALTGYARSSYAVDPCTAIGPSVQCTGGVFTDPVDLDSTAVPTENLAVTVTPGPFQVKTTTTGDALTITGNGAVSFIDTFAASYLDSSGYSRSTALSITSKDYTTGPTVTPGSVTVITHGTLIGGHDGIRAENLGKGALSVKAYGDVKGTVDYASKR